MVNQLGFTKRFLVLITPIVTSSALTPLVLSIAASPSLAATLASSKARFDIDDFSHNPLGIQSLTAAKSLAIATSGQVTAESKVFATIVVNPSPQSTFIDNSSFSRAKGNGSNYFGLADSLTEVIGYNFLVGEGETFSFDFKGFLDLETSIDAPQTENASAAGTLSLQLYDSTNWDNWIPLDSFGLSGALTTPGNGDFLRFNNSASISLDPSRTSFDTSFGERKEFANASVRGDFSRTFNSLTSLTLVEAKSNQASVAVPEPSSTLATLGLCLAGLGYRFRSKVFGAKTKITY
jgi:hypothetical protein